MKDAHDHNPPYMAMYGGGSTSQMKDAHDHDPPYMAMYGGGSTSQMKGPVLTVFWKRCVPSGAMAITREYFEESCTSNG